MAFFKPHVSLLPLLYFGFLRPHSCVLPTSEVRKLSTMKIDFSRKYIPITVGRSSTFSCGSKILFLSYRYMRVYFPPNAHSLQTKNKSPQQLSLLFFLWNQSGLSAKALPLSEPPLSQVSSLG